jgi:UDP-N-acetylglucosamine acyltransferase
MEIHPTALVSSKAEISSGVRIGPYCIIGDNVKIREDTAISSHSVIEGHTEIGRRNNIYPFVTIGTPPQDTGYKGEDTRVIIGDNNIIREYTTIHKATTKQDWVTIVGNNNYLMAYAHVAHDCVLGDHIVLSNVATLGGHTTVGDYANLSGLMASHQFVRIGQYAFVGGKTGLPLDVPPYMMAFGTRAKLYGPNLTGLKRHNFSKEAINGLKKAYMIIWRETGRFSEGIKRVREEMESFPELEILLDFISESKRGITR